MKNDKFCGSCIHFVGAGDWNLCCDNPPASAIGWFGHLCYADTSACENYKSKYKEISDGENTKNSAS